MDKTLNRRRNNSNTLKPFAVFFLQQWRGISWDMLCIYVSFTPTLRCISVHVVECRTYNCEIVGSNLGHGYCAPRSTQPSISLVSFTSCSLCKQVIAVTARCERRCSTMLHRITSVGSGPMKQRRALPHQQQTARDLERDGETTLPYRPTLITKQQLPCLALFLSALVNLSAACSPNQQNDP